jgi:hypothetical protein
MREQSLAEASDATGFVYFHLTGEAARGDFYCSDCGYGISVTRALPRCPMCGGQAWERRLVDRYAFETSRSER